MADVEYPSSDVLGLGKEVPSTLYAIASAPAFIFGAWACYQSNIAHTLTPENVKYVLGNLLAMEVFMAARVSCSRPSYCSGEIVCGSMALTCLPSELYTFFLFPVNLQQPAIHRYVSNFRRFAFAKFFFTRVSN